MFGGNDYVLTFTFSLRFCSATSDHKITYFSCDHHGITSEVYNPLSLSVCHVSIRRVRTSTSIRFEPTSISFVLHANFPRSGSKVDRFNPHTVGGLKQIEVDSLSVVGSVRSNCVFPATSIAS